jgi:altronate dehydratase large subunit
LQKILGYQRPDGQVGIRNHVAIVYTNDCSKVTARQIAGIVPSAHVFGWPHGCHWSQDAFNKLVALGSHPNVGGVLVLGIGCERIRAADVAAAIAKTGKPTGWVNIEEIGGSIKAIEHGLRQFLKISRVASDAPRVELELKDLILAVDCAASDSTSGLASNPATGVAVDFHVDRGAKTYFLDVPEELIGCGDCLAARACSHTVAADLRRLAAVAPDNPKIKPPYGNIRGGITTFREKAAGALAKSGTRPIQGVITDFKKPSEAGLYLVSAPPEAWTNDSDPQCVQIMAACGAHVVVETTGCGTVTGGVVAPVIKVCANPDTCQREPDNIDVDVSGIIKGTMSIVDAGHLIYNEVLAVAAGRLTYAEILGHLED